MKQTPRSLLTPVPQAVRGTSPAFASGSVRFAAWALLPAILLGMPAACKKKSSSSAAAPTAADIANDKAVDVERDDPAMNAAIAKARRTSPAFIAALRAPKAGQTGFSVKKPVTDPNGTEHFWMTEVTFDGTHFHGLIANDAGIVKSVNLGDKATVSPLELSDWMYVQEGKLVGGETLRVLRDLCKTDAEKREFDSALPFRIE